MVNLITPEGAALIRRQQKESDWEQGQNIPKVSDLFDDYGKPLPEDDRLMFVDFGDFVR